MKPYYQDNKVTIIQGHILNVLPSLPPNSVHCVVTSPPYWGLRDYGLPPQVWDDPGGCGHEWGGEIVGAGKNNDQTAGEIQQGNKGSINRDNRQTSQFCQKCNAWRGSLGLEPTPELYIQHIVQVFREIWRVLRKDGTVWLNLGDSYAGSGKSSGQESCILTDMQDSNIGSQTVKRFPLPQGLKPKDLCGIPWRVALALQADGWWLRSDIIWSKPNPMPESVTDRPTRSHEYVFLLTKSAKYFYDADAVREKQNELCRRDSSFRGGHTAYIEQKGPQDNSADAKRQTHGDGPSATGRNLRSVWTIATQPFPDAHFATFPKKLVEPCIKAGTPKEGIVLDPFGGSGRTAIVAKKLGRKCIIIELKEEYCSMPLDELKQERIF